jgi:hypothetical protein
MNGEGERDDVTSQVDGKTSEWLVVFGYSGREIIRRPSDQPSWSLAKVNRAVADDAGPLRGVLTA